MYLYSFIKVWNPIIYRKEVLEPLVQLFRHVSSSICLLMDDKANPNRAQWIDGYLESEDIHRMNRLARSLDFNTMQNFSDALGRVIVSHHPHSRTSPELKLPFCKSGIGYYKDHLLLPDHQEVCHHAQ
ncbi:hypothetical protein TNCV_1273461 [Trichonephila clavipes]|nr:hypothetical protein TNCV_1273461 [Trichonephila clavipes]